MIAALCLFMLLAAGDAWQVSHHRNDQVGSIQPPTQTDFGDWGQAEYCNDGSYAYGFKMNVGHTNSDDDTGVNGVVLFCKPTKPDENAQIASMYKMWGKWHPVLECPGDSTYLTGVSIKSQPKQGFRTDDTAANKFQFTCKDGTKLKGVGGPHGEWGNQVNCPSNSAICGIKTQVENYQKYGDNTALNGAIFYCCST
ncbi:vitelline membrane outer layer protein 1 [Exaiptasia diaphana]|uniref:Vitelline membrane outer layer protein 1 n=1 Tax=Exaiptasia diaphana TaxID=2652724 RepID=A0A913YE10_EXADI|nr:vitelline membrane outer layer protein 1 [Exaiptasia diaphana]